MSSQSQPSDAEMEKGQLIYAGLRTPDGLLPCTPLWHKVVDTGNGEFKEWYREAVQKAVAAYGGDPAQIEVRYVRRPPFSSPLIAQYFVDVASGLSVVIVAAIGGRTWDGFRRGNRIIQRSLSEKLAEAGIPPDTLTVYYSPAQLEEFAVSFVRRHGHPRAVLTTSRKRFNTEFRGGYWFRIDKTKPQGWEIVVRTRTVTYAFVVDSSARVLHAERREGRQRLELKISSLLEDGD